MDLQQQLETAKAARSQLERLQREASQVETLEKAIVSQQQQHQASIGFGTKVDRARVLLNDASILLQKGREQFASLVDLVQQLVDLDSEAQVKILEAQELLRAAAGQKVYASAGGDSIGADRVKLAEAGHSASRLASETWASLDTGSRLAMFDQLETRLDYALADVVRARVGKEIGRQHYIPSQASLIRWT